jgi:hypothetical protein
MLTALIGAVHGRVPEHTATGLPPIFSHALLNPQAGAILLECLVFAALVRVYVFVLCLALFHFIAPLCS